MAKQPETLFKERVLKDLRATPHTWCVKVQQKSIRGTPDILACVNSLFVALELKKDGKSKADHLQEYELAKIRQAGGLSLVVYPDNWAEVYGYLMEVSQAIAAKDRSDLKQVQRACRELS